MPLPSIDPRRKYVDDRHIAKDRRCFVCQEYFWSSDAGDRYCGRCRKKLNDPAARKVVIKPAIEEYFRDRALQSRSV